MKISAYIAVITAAVPAVWSLPQGLVGRQFTFPTCNAEKCLASTNGTFVATGASNGTAPRNLAGLCSLPQDDLNLYVQTVKPCIDDNATNNCTAGAVYRKSNSMSDDETCSPLTDARIQGTAEDRMREASLQQASPVGLDSCPFLSSVLRLQSYFTIPRSFSIIPEFGHSVCAFTHKTITHDVHTHTAYT